MLKVWHLADANVATKELTLTFAWTIECTTVSPDSGIIVAGDVDGDIYCLRLVVGV